MIRFVELLVVAFTATLLFGGIGCQSETDPGVSNETFDAIVFIDPYCPKCERFKAEILPLLDEMELRVETVDVSTDEGVNRFLALADSRDLEIKQMAPLLVFDDRVFTDIEEMHRALRGEELPVHPLPSG